MYREDGLVLMRDSVNVASDCNHEVVPSSNDTLVAEFFKCHVAAGLMYGLMVELLLFHPQGVIIIDYCEVMIEIQLVHRVCFLGRLRRCLPECGVLPWLVSC